MMTRQDLAGGEAKIEAFLTYLAVEKAVSPSTQNQAVNALLFLYKHVLKIPLEGKSNAVRIAKKVNVPVVMTQEEVTRIITIKFYGDWPRQLTIHYTIG
jgi:site-specific recombinase XerD